MNRIRNVAISLVVVLGAALHASPAAAATPVSCSAKVNGYLDDVDGVDWLATKGVRVTARGTFGFSAFTMQNRYQVETYPLHTPGAAQRQTFFAYRNRNTNANFSGYFHEVFPDRGNGDEDRWEFWVGRGGRFYLRSITWGGGWGLMQRPVCYAGPGGQLVVTGQFDNPGFGTDFWTFVMAPDQLI
jgi:hypothetical protein